MEKPVFITSKDSSDNFVGIRFADGRPEVVFPHGYRIPKDEKERRKDVFRLLSVLQRFGKQREGSGIKGKSKIVSQFPIESYQYVIQDFLARGYYVEKETVFSSDTQGKISWKRTIQKETPQISDGNVVYLRFQVKKELNDQNKLITQIHRYCVYQSFNMFGWLYLTSDFLPQDPKIQVNVSLFTSALRNALSHTFDDRKKRLFHSMLNIVNMEREDINFQNWSLGVQHFAGIWERLINYVFGEDDIEEYFPHANWFILKDGKLKQSSALEPDTIMLYEDKYYILDAKYYQYGITDDPDDLPHTSSIQKQVTYAEHLAKVKDVDKDKIYNAFVMPYQASGKDGDYVLRFVAVGMPGWKDDSEMHNYMYILGLMLDTRHLITTFSKHNSTEIENLAELMEESLVEYKKMINVK